MIPKKKHVPPYLMTILSLRRVINYLQILQLDGELYEKDKLQGIHTLGELILPIPETGYPVSKIPGMIKCLKQALASLEKILKNGEKNILLLEMATEYFNDTIELLSKVSTKTSATLPSHKIMIIFINDGLKEVEDRLENETSQSAYFISGRVTAICTLIETLKFSTVPNQEIPEMCDELGKALTRATNAIGRRTSYESIYQDIAGAINSTKKELLGRIS